MWHNIWYALLGLLFCGYLVLDGVTIGTGVIQRMLVRGDADRHTVAAATGPFYLGNEVWLVAAAGITLGGLPGLESAVFGGLYPVIVLAVAALLLRHSAMQFRRRVKPGLHQGFWESAVQLACLVLAVVWGALGGILLSALPLRDGRLPLDTEVLLRPVPVLSALTAVAVFALHSAVFLAGRTEGPVSGRALVLARRLMPVAAGLAVVTAAATVVDDHARAGLLNPLAAVVVALLGLAALVRAPRGAAAGGRAAWLVSGAALAAPVLLIGVSHFPQAVVSSVPGARHLSIADVAADPATLSVVGPLVLLVLPVLLAFQAMQWWAFRGRSDDRSQVYF